MTTTCASMGIINEQLAIIQPLASGWYAPYVATVAMLRLDMIHPTISGNKWYKLRYNLQLAREQGYRTILTFGGAYSNHLVAAAAAAKEYGLQSIGVVRGVHTTAERTDTLKDCSRYGMQLVFASREEYARKTDAIWLQAMAEQYDNPYIIPEGGANEQGVKGAADITKLIPIDYTHICVSAGTGTTLAGLRQALPTEQAVIGFVPMKQGSYLVNELIPYLSPKQNINWQLYDKWHFGGFGKWNDELIDFMNDFNNSNNIPLDMVYTAKMMYGVCQLLAEGYFAKQARVLCVHTGGLQGNVSIADRLAY